MTLPQTKINSKLVDKILQSKRSEASSHPPHGEDNLCADCEIKRILWRTDLKELAADSTMMIIRDFARDKGDSFVTLHMYTLEMLIVGFILGKAYIETQQIEQSLGEGGKS